MPSASVSASERIYRARRIGVTFARIYLGIRTQRFIARRLRPSDMAERWARFNRASAQSIYDTAIELRGLILKGCQFIGSRADVLPPEYVEILSRLQDQVPPKPFPVVRQIVEAELGGDLAEIFESFDQRPIASASLAQVHAARLRSGERVAVKVQYPEIEALVRTDLSSLRTLFRAVGLLERDFDLLPLIDELGQYVPLELDFENEGRNAETVAGHFAHRDDVLIPEIFWSHTSRRVLVMEFMHGVKITDLSALRRAEIDPQRVAQLLVETFCEQILVRGVFHADPHPGNLLVQHSPTGPRLVLLDFGLVKDLPAGFRQGIAAFAVSLLRGDADAMAAALLDLGFETRDGSPDSLATIARFLLDAAIKVQDRSFLDRDLAGRIGQSLTDEIRSNPIVRAPSHVVLLGRVLGLLSGVNRSLETKLDLVQTILPYALSSNSERPHR
jgi:predicted unusual protein kinase regulating ubiquinone biosynthesis (AarF/ABC1/UbiB family)